MQPDMKKGPSVAPLGPLSIASIANALSTYLADQPECKANEHWIVVPRQAAEQAIDLAIDWLDLTDRLAAQSAKQAEAPENAL